MLKLLQYYFVKAEILLNGIFNVGAKIGTGQASIQAGTCEYQGKTYLALSVGSDSTMTLFFTGLHSGDCLFSIVNLNDVSWNE